MSIQHSTGLIFPRPNKLHKQIGIQSFVWCTDTSDPRHFGPKTVRHYIFGTKMSYFFVSVPKCLWDTSALVPNLSQHFMKGTLRH